MSFRLVIAKKAQKEIRKIDKRLKDRIIAALVSLRNDPFIGKRLQGEFKGYWSYKIWPYRIIYEIHKQELLILVVKIGHRQGIYK